MAKVTLKDLTSRGLKALAKDIKFPKYSRMSIKNLRNGLLKADLSKVNLSKYDLYDTEEEAVEVKVSKPKAKPKAKAAAKPKAKKNEAIKVPLNPRRSIRRNAFGRR